MAQMLKLKPTHGVAPSGQTSIETHETVQALEAVLNRHRMREHDLAAEMIARRAKLEAQALAEAREVTGAPE
jgi:hypothetical protein